MPNNLSRPIVVFSLFIVLTLAGWTNYEQACVNELDIIWEELDECMYESNNTAVNADTDMEWHNNELNYCLNEYISEVSWWNYRKLITPYS